MPPNDSMIPDSLDGFASKARSFVKRAKEQGKSNTAIANTLDYMFNLYYLRSQEEKDDLRETSLEDVDGDGIMELVDTQTGEVIQNYGGENTEDWAGLEGITEEGVDEEGAALGQGRYEEELQSMDMQTGGTKRGELPSVEEDISPEELEGSSPGLERRPKLREDIGLESEQESSVRKDFGIARENLEERMRPTESTIRRADEPLLPME